MTITELSVLGATGSIGCSTLDIVRRFPERFRVAALAAKTRVDRLAAQIREFGPRLAAVFDAATAAALTRRLPDDCTTEILYGDDGYRAAATIDGVGTVVSAMVGAAGLMPTLAAIDAGRTVALANKETLVMAGELVMARAVSRGVTLVPVDSEHSAIFQCLSGNRRADLDKILLTGSGGPFRTRPPDTFCDITVEEALHHPNWSMGPKITIDSATMMNKGLEVIEARHLFGLAADRIEVVIHPQSIVHSMVSFRDGTVMAQLGRPDMKGAIAYALSHPERLPIGMAPPDFPALGALHFAAPDNRRFPCLPLAFEVLAVGGTAPAVLNAANEVAVEAFLRRRIRFHRIPELIRDTLSAHAPLAGPSLGEITDADRWARRWASDRIGSMAA